MVHYEIEQGKINIYTDLTLENCNDQVAIAKDYNEINKIIEVIFPKINVVMLPEKIEMEKNK